MSIASEAAVELALAKWLGAHAFALFAFALCTLLAGTALARHFVSRHLRPTLPGMQPSPMPLVLLLVAGFGVIVGAAAAFSEIAEGIGPGGDIARFDDALVVAIGANLAPAVRDVFAVVTRLGDPATIVALAALVAIAFVVRGRRRLAFGWVAALAGNALLNATLKQVFERVRPVHDPAIVDAQGWSFPSGHSSGAVVTYGLLAYVLVRALPERWHPPVVLTAAALAFTIGSSRVFVQVHFPSDVVAGFLSGSAWLAVCVVGFELARRSGAR